MAQEDLEKTNEVVIDKKKLSDDVAQKALHERATEDGIKDAEANTVQDLMPEIKNEGDVTSSELKKRKQEAEARLTELENLQRAEAELEDAYLRIHEVEGFTPEDLTDEDLLQAIDGCTGQFLQFKGKLRQMGGGTLEEIEKGLAAGKIFTGENARYAHDYVKYQKKIAAHTAELYKRQAKEAGPAKEKKEGVVGRVRQWLGF